MTEYDLYACFYEVPNSIPAMYTLGDFAVFRSGFDPSNKKLDRLIIPNVDAGATEYGITRTCLITTQKLRDGLKRKNTSEKVNELLDDFELVGLFKSYKDARKYIKKLDPTKSEKYYMSKV